MHYRKEYASPKVNPLPLFAHITNWILLSLALLIYQVKPEWRALGLGLAGVLAYLLARHARSLGIRWVHLSDTLIGQALVVAGILSFYPLIENLQLLLLVLFIETLLFLRLSLVEGEDLPVNVGVYAMFGAGMFLFAFGLIFGLTSPLSEGLGSARNLDAIYLLIGAVAGVIAHVHFTRKYAKRSWLLRSKTGAMLAHLPQFEN